MRNDGDITFFTVEMNGYNGTRWHGVGDSIWANIPSQLRHFEDSARTGKEREPFHSYGANGPVWQRTGESGWYDIELATQAMMIVAQYNLGIEFRVIRKRMLEERTQMAQVKFDVEMRVTL